MPLPISLDDVRTRARQVPPVPALGTPAVRLGLAVCLAFALDGATTCWGLAQGGRELNPLVAGLAPGPYGVACALRAGIACALLAATCQRTDLVRATTRLGCLVLVALKLAAAVSNLAGGV